MSNNADLGPFAASFPTNGAAKTAATEHSAHGADVERAVEAKAGSSWFTKLVAYYIRHHAPKTKARESEKDSGKSETDRAHSAIRWACIKSAVTGASAGAVSTGATLVTAQTEGIGGIVAVPIAAAAIGGEMVYRAFVHVDLTWQLAEIFGVNFDTTDQKDLWRLYALAFGTSDHEENHGADPGKALVHEVSHVEGEQVGEQIGHQVLGESVMRNVVPFVGIASAAITNYMVTRKLGDTIRRYMRYQRALSDAFANATHACRDHLEMLIEGVWFIFSADGKLLPEEAAVLAHLLQKLDPIARHAVTARFTEDEHDWAHRLDAEIPGEVRRSFFHALEVAAAVDKEVGLPERKILRRAARELGLEFDMARIERMIADLSEIGVLSDESLASYATSV
jgi:hypothetical protein